MNTFNVPLLKKYISVTNKPVNYVQGKQWTFILGLS